MFLLDRSIGELATNEQDAVHSNYEDMLKKALKISNTHGVVSPLQASQRY